MMSIFPSFSEFSLLKGLTEGVKLLIYSIFSIQDDDAVLFAEKLFLTILQRKMMRKIGISFFGKAK